MQYVIDKSIASNASYPYTSFFTKRRNKCKSPTKTDRYKITAQTNPNGDLFGDEEALKRQLMNGPTVAVVTANVNFNAYRSGIFNDVSCKNGEPDHVVLLVGYDVDPKGTNYWLLKNSWGEEGRQL